ncbi:MAG: GlcNAc-transferase family protein [Vicinamibacterales bacterium]
MIFVSIASYTDPELPRTLRDCLDNARWPGDLRFGICWQADPGVQVPLDVFRTDPRFSFDDWSIEQSRGGTWARSRAQRLWNGEELTLQVDSHMTFEPEWDERLIGMLEALPGRRPLLTVNSPLFWWDDAGRLVRDVARGVPTTRVNHWTSGMGWAPWFDFGPRYPRLPGRNRFVSGNFVFTLGRWNEDVPQDPDHYYWGEEFSLTVRSFTSGYDLWAPREIVVWHMLHRHGPPRRHWEQGRDIVDGKNAVAFDRLRKLVYSGESQALGRYGLGTERTLHDYEIYAGFDLANKRAHPDVFTGRPPDPVTIHGAEDWARCCTIEEAFAGNPGRTALQSFD